VNDKAGKDYWNKNWDSEVPVVQDPKDLRLSNYVNNQYHNLFSKILGADHGNSKRLLEVGCARSMWLPYFAKQYGLEIWGLDYSEEGCRQEESILRKIGVKAEVVCADLFSPPEKMLGIFDYVFSAGVIEHFSDTFSCLKALTRFLSPGGTIISVVPNMHGSVGALQRFVDKKVYELHVALTPEELRIHHEELGLIDIKSEYFLFANYYVINSMHIKRNLMYFPIKIFHSAIGRLSMLVWIIERMLRPLKPVRAFSPYIVCSARKKLI
jgi:2-polyprenyl-3-methyl-5-hydroxy-6-metoxy-1,4-benzoquinol methylase